MQIHLFTGSSYAAQDNSRKNGDAASDAAQRQHDMSNQLAEHTDAVAPTSSLAASLTPLVDAVHRAKVS